ncbi:MAG: NAD(P)H-dependent oxidoreductase [Deltaproteobacteria bacterium]|nr:NAD(P)H-dependent oxidoreductase [Deltaproteobacteria bacterium]
MARVLAFSGSGRGDSFNKKLLALAARGASEAGASVTTIELRDFALPLYDGDLETREYPAGAAQLRELLAAHDALLLACPEYNGGIAPLLKNTLDWMTRAPGGKADPRVFAGRTAAICSAAAGPFGGMRGLRWARELLTNLGVLVLPDQVTVGSAFKAFDANGELVEEWQRKAAAALGADLAKLADARGVK